MTTDQTAAGQQQAQRRALVESALQSLLMAASTGTYMAAADDTAYDAAVFAYRRIMAAYGITPAI